MYQSFSSDVQNPVLNIIMNIFINIFLCKNNILKSLVVLFCFHVSEVVTIIKRNPIITKILLVHTSCWCLCRIFDFNIILKKYTLSINAKIVTEMEKYKKGLFNSENKLTSLEMIELKLTTYLTVIPQTNNYNLQYYASNVYSLWVIKIIFFNS